jgi:spore germination protein GerM
MKSNKIWIVLLVFFFLAGVTGSYVLFRALSHKQKPAVGATASPAAPASTEDFFDLRMYYPVEGRLEAVERKLPRRTKQYAIAEAVIEEYFRGPGDATKSVVPQNVSILGIYKGSDQVLYVDLSDEVRRNFQGDALAEFLLLKGLYESLLANLQGIQDVEILVEGKEIETLGGHFYLKYPLKNLASYEFHGDTRISRGQ